MHQTVLWPLLVSFIDIPAHKIPCYRDITSIDDRAAMPGARVMTPNVHTYCVISDILPYMAIVIDEMLFHHHRLNTGQ